VDGDVHAAPGLDGGLVISLRGGDFELTVGQDFSIGYLEHDTERVRLYIEESFTFLVLSPQAAIPLVSAGK
ncbi:MAG: bacteriocin, partial [Reyranella sp.]